MPGSFVSLLTTFRGALLFGRLALAFLRLAGSALKIHGLRVAGCLFSPAVLTFRWRIRIGIAHVTAHFHSLAPFLLPPIIIWLLVLLTSVLPTPFLLLLLISTAGVCAWHSTLHKLSSS